MNNRVVNLTPHAVRVLDDLNSPVIEFAPSGTVARLRESLTSGLTLRVHGVDCPAALVRYVDTVEGLPFSRPGVILLVSRVLAAAVVREDLYFPGGEVRAQDGTIIGCRYLGRFTMVRSSTEPRDA